MSDHVAWCRYIFNHEKPTRIVLCDSDSPGAFPVFRRAHGDECNNDKYAKDVCEGMYADKCDDVIGLVEALRAVLALAGESAEIRKIVADAIEEHGGSEAC